MNLHDKMRKRIFQTLNTVKLCFLLFICYVTVTNQTNNNVDIQVSKNDNDKSTDGTFKPHRMSHILMYHPWGTKSHRGQQNALINGLLERGHTITGVFSDESDLNHENYTEIIVETSFKKFLDMATSSMLSQDATSPLVQIASFPRLIRILYDMYFELLDHYKIIKNYVGTNQVDAVTLTAFFPENGLYLSHYFMCPTILLSPIGPVPHFSHYFGNPENPSYMPDTRMPFIEPMNFRARFFNTLYYVFLDILNIQQRLMGHVLSSNQLMEYEEFIQSYQEMSLLLENSHFVTHNSQAKVANTVNIGGIHCREGRPLPQDLSNFLNQAKSGAIYVSFGSVIKSSLMPKEKLDSFLETFRQIKYPVIWKWDADQIPNLPANVMLKKWLPQQDLLAHRNLKVFVTHGGIFSLQEAIYHNTPLVGIPLGTDQKPNLMRAQQRGYALMLDWQSLNASIFTEAINKVMHDPSFANNMNTAHKQFIDQKETPLERGIWWIEYVIRHKGAQFLKPQSLKLAFYQYHLLDVISLLVLIAIISSIILIILLKCCCKLWCSRSNTKQKSQ